MRIEPWAKVAVKGDPHEWIVSDPATVEFDGRTYVRVERVNAHGRLIHRSFWRGDVTVRKS
jgi:hypothetical protein